MTSTPERRDGAHTLCVIPFSHYCELSRWALQRAGVEVTEKWALPGLHLFTLPTKPKGESVDGADADVDESEARAKAKATAKSTPFVLLPGSDGACLRESWDVLDYAGLGAAPSPRLKRSLESLAGASRVLVYSHVLHSEGFDGIVAQCSLVQRTLWFVLGGKIKAVMQAKMIRGPDNVTASIRDIDAAIVEIEDELQLTDPETHPTTLTPSVLAAASLMQPLVLHPKYLSGSGMTMPLENTPKTFQAEVSSKYRATKLGKFVMRVYDDERTVPAASVDAAPAAQ